MNKIISTLLILLLAISCHNSNNDAKTYNYSIKKSVELTNQLADLYTKKYFEQYPESATSKGIEDAKHDRLTDNSLKSVEKWQNFEDSVLFELKKINSEQLTGKQEWVTYGFIKEQLEASVALRVCRTELWEVNHLSNWILKYTKLAKKQAVGNDTVRKSALKRWSQFPHFLKTEIKNLKLGIKLGYTSPKPIVLLMIKQLDELLALPVKESPFCSPAIRDTSEFFKAEWEKLVETSILPAINDYTSFLKNKYLNQARTTISISALPDGKKNYKAFYRYFTTLNTEPDDVYDIALFYVKLNEAKIKIIGEKLFKTSDIPTLRELIKNQPKEELVSKKKFLAFINKTISNAQNRVSEYFNILPTGELLIKSVPKNMERYGFAYYVPASMDSLQLATFYVKALKSEKAVKGYLEATIFHETFPGHHIQLGVVKELPKIHIITKHFFNTGFVEGWANYATILAEEIGLFSSDYASIYFINGHSKMMVLDAGIHVRGWTREYAINWLLENTNTSKKSALNTVNRVIAWPGQFSSYDAGSVEILELRERAKITLGEKFDIKEFHDQVIGSGSITLNMLREKMDRWINLKSKQNKTH